MKKTKKLRTQSETEFDPTKKPPKPKKKIKKGPKKQHFSKYAIEFDDDLD